MLVFHPEERLFTRRQVSALAGVPEGVLSFWIKNDLLLSSEGGAGRGSHRKFSRIQISFAAILERLRRFGINIGELRAFSKILQRGEQLCGRVVLHPSSLLASVSLVEQLARFRRGESVTISKRIGGEVKTVVAETELDIIDDIRWQNDYDPLEEIISFSKRLSEDDRNAVESFEVLHSATVGLSMGGIGWLLWQNEMGDWSFAEQSPDYADLPIDPHVETAIFIAVEKVVRRVWGFDVEEYRRQYRLNYLAELRRRAPERVQQWITKHALEEEDRQLLRALGSEG